MKTNYHGNRKKRQRHAVIGMELVLRRGLERETIENGPPVQGEPVQELTERFRYPVTLNEKAKEQKVPVRCKKRLFSEALLDCDPIRPHDSNPTYANERAIVEALRTTFAWEISRDEEFCKARDVFHSMTRSGLRQECCALGFKSSNLSKIALTSFLMGQIDARWSEAYLCTLTTEELYTECGNLGILPSESKIATVKLVCMAVKSRATRLASPHGLPCFSSFGTIAT